MVPIVESRSISSAMRRRRHDPTEMPELSCGVQQINEISAKFEKDEYEDDVDSEDEYDTIVATISGNQEDSALVQNLTGSYGYTSADGNHCNGAVFSNNCNATEHNCSHVNEDCCGNSADQVEDCPCTAGNPFMHVMTKKLLEGDTEDTPWKKRAKKLLLMFLLPRRQKELAFTSGCDASSWLELAAQQHKAQEYSSVTDEEGCLEAELLKYSGIPNQLEDAADSHRSTSVYQCSVLSKL